MATGAAHRNDAMQRWEEDQTMDVTDPAFPDAPPDLQADTRAKSPVAVEFESRRCAICGAKYPPFGFGPPLTRKDVMVWACGAHHPELRDRLAARSIEPLENDSSSPCCDGKTRRLDANVK
jgi:hypothetical protein